MHFTPLLSVYCLATLALSQIVDWRDIPGVCSPVCYAVVNLAQSCEHNGSNDYITCVCDNNVAAEWIPNCQACIAAVSRDNTNVNSLLSSCSFTATTWTGATTGTGTATAVPTTDNAQTTSTTESTGTTATSTSTVGTTSLSSSSGTSTRSSSTTRTTGTGITAAASASGTSSTASEFTGAAAPVVTACLGIVYAMMGLPAIL